jgi:hypothetical protein
VPADEGNELARFEGGGVEAGGVPDDQEELLPLWRADRDDEAAGFGELIEKRLGNRRGGGGDENGVERSELGDAEGTVSAVNVDVGKAEAGEAVSGSEDEILAEFDGVDAGDDARKNGGLVAGSRADIEDAVRGLQMKSGGHNGDDVGLRNSLAAADGQRGILVGAGLQRCGYELVAWDLLHGAEDEGI